MSIKKIESLSSKKTILFMSVLFIFFVPSIVLFIIIPNIKLIERKSVEIRKERLALEVAPSKIDVSRDLNKNAEDLNTKISKIDNAFMKKGEELNLIKILEATALKNNVKQTIFPGALGQSSDDSFSVMSIKLDLLGSFRNVMNYIQDIESLESYINIDSVDITRVQERYSSDGDDDNQSGNVSCVILANTYWK